MRYFRDLGIDAHLILFKNDVTSSQSHFKPEFDTWEIEKWAPFIHYVNFSSHYAALFYPAFLLKKYFNHYDIFISCRYSPIILNKCGFKIHIYYPTLALKVLVIDCLGKIGKVSLLLLEKFVQY